MKKLKSYSVGILGNCCTHGEFVAVALQEEPQAIIVSGWEAEQNRNLGLSKVLGKKLVSSADELLTDTNIDIIAICCSPHEKAYWIERAINEGKHIFLNKPMCESLESANRIENAVKNAGVQLVYDIPVIKFHPLEAKILRDVKSGSFGKPINYAHSWSFTFSTDFALEKVWPERLDPPSRSGGGEMTNMGCYPVDYMVSLWGEPKAIQAKTSDYWEIYGDAGVENFGQIIADYGSFFAEISTGKQPLHGIPTMDVEEALNPRNWHNVIEMQFQNHNLTLLPFQDTFFHNGKKVKIDEFLFNFEVKTSFQQLVTAIETGEKPESNVEIARLGVEVLMAAYSSSLNESSVITLPFKDEKNPLTIETL